MTQILVGDALANLRELPDGCARCCVTSPPYWGLRDYGIDGQLGLESTPAEYVEKIVAVFREVWRVLADDGTLWLNLGDSYAGSGKGAWNVDDATKKAAGVKEVYLPKIDPVVRGKRGAKRWGGGDNTCEGLAPKNLVGIPWRVAFALQADGWYLRSDIIWSKPNPMPESVTDRPTKSHEYIFLLSKSATYYYDADAIAEPASAATAPRAARAQESDSRANGVPGQASHTLHAPRKSDKQRGHSRRHAGFNDRWDAMEKAEQCSGTRNARTVWEIATKPFKGAHFATFPPELASRCIRAGSARGDTVLDPFAGAGTTLLVADRLGRQGIGIELNPAYAEMARLRVRDDAPLFADAAPTSA